MLALARSIALSKWEILGQLPFQTIPLDGATNDFRTKNHSLSFWTCDPSAEASIDDVVLAIAASRDNVQKVDIVWLKEKELRKRRVKVSESPGQTKIAHLINRHRDLVELDLSRFATLARITTSAVAANDCRVYSEKRVLDLLCAAVRGNSVQLSDLRPSIQTKVSTELSRTRPVD